MHYSSAALSALIILNAACSETFWIHDASSSDHFDSVEESDSTIASTDTGDEADAGVFVCSNKSTGTDSHVRPKLSIVVALDTSAGMEDEVSQFQEAINGFFRAIDEGGIDLRLVLISTGSAEKIGVCAAAPLGGGTCPEDSRPPSYLHIIQPVGSRDGLSKILALHDQWKDAVHPDGILSFLVISDDESDMDRAAFESGLAAFQPSIASFVFYAIASSTEKAAACESSPEGACCAVAVKEGVIYKDIVEATGGLFEDLCLRDIEGSLFSIANDAVKKSCPEQGIV